MIDQLTLDTALDTPEGATLVSSHGTVTLLHVRHAHADQVCIERYPLGAAIEVAQLVRLLGSLGLLPAPAETPGLPAPAAAPMAAAADSTVACPDCGTRTTPRGMGYHRRHAHGVVGEELLQGPLQHREPFALRVRQALRFRDQRAGQGLARAEGQP